MLAAEDLLLHRISCVEMGQVHVRYKYSACRCVTGGACVCGEMLISVIIPQRQEKRMCHSQ